MKRQYDYTAEIIREIRSYVIGFGWSEAELSEVLEELRELIEEVADMMDVEIKGHIEDYGESPLMEDPGEMKEMMEEKGIYQLLDELC